MSSKYDPAEAREYYLANRERILERQRVYRETHREECNARSRAAHQANPEPAAKHAQARAKRFRDMREEMARAQDFMCPCGEPLGDERALDHDHSCCDKTVRNSCRKCDRGVMHHRCNLLLSMVDDDPAKLRNLADYLEFYKIIRGGDGGEGGVREPSGGSPDSPAPGKPGLPGGSDDYGTLEPTGNDTFPWMSLSEPVPDWPILPIGADYECTWAGARSRRPDGTWHSRESSRLTENSMAPAPS